MRAFVDVFEEHFRRLKSEPNTCACGALVYGGAAECQPCFDRDRARGSAGPIIREQVPPRYVGRGFSSYECPPGDASARSRVADASPGQGLFLWSKGKGTGKSHLAYAALQARAQAGASIAAIDWTEYLDRRKLSMAGDAEAEEWLRARLRQLRTADLALVDDLAAGRLTEWALAELWSVVSARYLSGGSLLVTTNFAPGELPGVLLRGGDPDTAERIVSRLAQMCAPLEVRGTDYRLLEARK